MRFTITLGMVLLCLLLPPEAAGQKVGTSSMQFLSVAPDARSSGFGTAFVAMAAGAHALYWNPAGLARAGGHTLALDRVNWLLDATHYAVGYGVNLGSFGHLGAQFYLADMGQFKETRVDHLGFVDRDGTLVYNPGLTGNTFSLSSWVLGLTYARNFTDRFAAGLSTKVAREDLWLASDVAVLFDFGITYATGFRSLRLAASVMNFGAPVSYGEDSFPVPLLFRLGGAMDLVGSAGLVPVHDSSRLTATFDLIQPNDYDQQWAAGLEYSLFQRLFVRSGYQHNFDAVGFSYGLGALQTIGPVRLGVDYSYTDMTEALGVVHRLGLSLTTD